MKLTIHKLIRLGNIYNFSLNSSIFLQNGERASPIFENHRWRDSNSQSKIWSLVVYHLTDTCFFGINMGFPPIRWFGEVFVIHRLFTQCTLGSTNKSLEPYGFWYHRLLLYCLDDLRIRILFTEFFGQYNSIINTFRMYT